MLEMYVEAAKEGVSAWTDDILRMNEKFNRRNVLTLFQIGFGEI